MKHFLSYVFIFYGLFFLSMNAGEYKQNGFQRFFKYCVLQAIDFGLDCATNVIGTIVLRPIDHSINFKLEHRLHLRVNYLKAIASIKDIRNFPPDERNCIIIRAIINNNIPFLKKSCKIGEIKLIHKFDPDLSSTEQTCLPFYSFYPNMSQEICSVLADHETIDDYNYLVLQFNNEISQHPAAEKMFTAFIKKFGVIDFLKYKTNPNLLINDGIATVPNGHTSIPSDYVLGSVFVRSLKKRQSSYLYRTKEGLYNAHQAFPAVYAMTQNITFQRYKKLSKAALLTIGHTEKIPLKDLTDIVLDYFYTLLPINYWLNQLSPAQ